MHASGTDLTKPIQETTHRTRSSTRNKKEIISRSPRDREELSKGTGKAAFCTGRKSPGASVFNHTAVQLL